MPRKLFKRYAPDPNSIRSHHSLQWLGSSLESPNIWHMNKQSVARAFFIGLFVAFLPVPMQMVLAALGSLWVHANLPISVALVWITNPLTFAPMFFFAYKVGAAVLQIETNIRESALSGSNITEQLSLIWQPLLLGSLICGLCSGLIAYIVIGQVWRWHVSKQWQQRKLKHRRKRKPTGSRS